MDKSFFWSVLLVLMIIVAYLVIPRRQFFRLLPFGIVSGFMVVLALLLFTVPLTGIWVFDIVPQTSILGVPLSLPLVWIPITMVFAYYTPKFDSRNMLMAWICIFTATITLLQGLINSAGIMRFVRWDLTATLLLTFAYFTFLALFVLKYGMVPEHQKGLGKFFFD